MIKRDKEDYILDCPVCGAKVTLRNGKGKCKRCKAQFNFTQVSESEINITTGFNDII